MADVLILGAGVSGLACADALSRGGAQVTVLDKGRGVGGRVATRRIEGQPTDHGLAFFHGTDPTFLAAIDAVPGEVVEGWPWRVLGSGAPCNPAAFDPLQPARRLAFAAGVSAFPKALAAGLDVRAEVQAARLGVEGDQIHVVDKQGGSWRAPTVVLAAPVEQAVALLAHDRAFAAAAALLRLVGTVPCQALIAAYDGPDDPLDAELFLPEDSEILQLVSHDSSKRPAPRRRILVIQARARWSAANLDAAPQAVVATLLAETARLLGDWAGAPAVVQHHRWRYARVQGGDTFAAPYLSALAGGARLGLTGESFHPAGGVEGAFLAGRHLARQVLGVVRPGGAPEGGSGAEDRT